MENRMICYGYGISRGNIVVKQEEAEIVREIFRLYIDGNSLKAIAESLTARGIEFFNGNSKWDKIRVSRTIQNEKYVGALNYPEIVDVKIFDLANSLRNKKGFVKEELDNELIYLKSTVYCGQCGKQFLRRKTWATREKWHCPNKCACDVYMSDEELLNGIVNVFRMIKQNPDIVRNVQAEQSFFERSREIMRNTNEIGRMTGSPAPSFNTVKKLIFANAAIKFRECKEDKAAAYTDYLIESILSAQETDWTKREFLRKYITRIEIRKDGAVSIDFINGAKVAAHGNKERRVCRRRES